MQRENAAPATGQVNAGTWKKALPYLALVSGTLALSLSGLFIRWAEAPGTVTSFFRMVVATVFLLPFVLKNANAQPLPKRRLLLLPLLGGLFVALDHGTWSTSIQFTRVGMATLFNNIAPLWVALFAAFFWRERLTSKFWIGLGLTLAGIAVVFGDDLIGPAGRGAQNGNSTLLGNSLAVFSSLFYCAYYLVTQHARRTVATLPYVWLVTAGGAFFLLIANLGLGRPLTGYPALTYWIFLAAGLISQVGGYFSVAYALGHLPASVVAPSMVAQPVLTALMAIPLAGEMLQPGQWMGSIVVLAGIYLVNASRNGTN